MGEESEILK